MHKILLCLSLLLAGCGEMVIRERNLIRPDAPGTPAEAARFASPGTSELQLVRPDGAVLRGVLVEQPGAKLTVLYFGGNMFHLDRHLDSVLPVFAGCRVNVATFDYRGYGRSSGKPTVETMAGDALASFDALNARFPGTVVVHGQSLGSFVAARVAQQRPVKAVVLESTATNVLDVVNAGTPWYVKPFISLSVEPSLGAIDNRSAAATIRSASLVIAGERDRVTPPRLGRAVYDALMGTPKRFLLAPQAGHEDALDSNEVRDSYCAFLRDADA